jgi:hypothetical protein
MLIIRYDMHLSFQLQTELKIWYTRAKIINYQTT